MGKYRTMVGVIVSLGFSAGCGSSPRAVDGAGEGELDSQTALLALPKHPDCALDPALGGRRQHRPERCYE